MRIIDNDPDKDNHWIAKVGEKHGYYMSTERRQISKLSNGALWSEIREAERSPQTEVELG
jgi:hypothetical protein